MHASLFWASKIFNLKVRFFFFPSYVLIKKNYIRVIHIQAITGSLLDVVRYIHTYHRIQKFTMFRCKLQSFVHNKSIFLMIKKIEY